MNKEQENCTLVATLLGKAFIRLPRKILDMWMLSGKKDRAKAKAYIALITKAFYVDGPVKLRSYKHVCRRGEYVGTYQELSKLTGITAGSVGHYLRLLVDDGLIRVKTIPGGVCIGIVEYDYFSGKEMETNTQQREAEPSRTLADAEQEMGGRSMQAAECEQERSAV